MDTAKIILVTRKTRLEGLIERYNTRDQVRFYLEHNDAQVGEHRSGGFELYAREHDVYYQALQRLQDGLAKLGKLHVIERAYLPNFLFGEDDIVVTIGIDGLVVNTAKYLDGQPLVAVNPDPAHIDGILLPFSVDQASEVVKRAINGEANARRISMAQAQLQDGQSLLAFNDLFIGARSHVSAQERCRRLRGLSSLPDSRSGAPRTAILQRRDRLNRRGRHRLAEQPVQHGEWDVGIF